MPTTTIKIQSEKKLDIELMASAIRDLSRGMKVLKEGPLKERAILLLLKDITGLSMTDIEKVLAALPALEKTYLK